MLTLACDSTNKPTPHDYTVQWECFYEECVYKIFGPSLPSTPFSLPSQQQPNSPTYQLFQTAFLISFVIFFISF